MIYDVCIIGAGPGGYVAAIEASKLGLKVVIIEKENIGGVCLNKGCIPTKALLHCAEVFKKVKNAENLGISFSNLRIDIQKMVSFSRNVVNKLTSGVESLLRKNKISIINGFASFIDKNTLLIKKNDNIEEKITSKYIIIATGAKPRIIENIKIDEEMICTYEGAMLPKILPKKIAIIGGGVIGLEFACFYNTLGSEVSIFETSNEILPFADSNIKTRIHEIFKKDGIKIFTSAKVTNANKNKEFVDLEFEFNNEKKFQKFDKVIISIGILPNIENLNLQKINVDLNINKTIKINDYCQTSVDNIYAIGDIVPGLWLAHKASAEGVLAAKCIAFKLQKMDHLPRKNNHSLIPSCIYTSPQISSIGMTEEEVKLKNIEYEIGTFSSIGNGKALATEDKNAFIKIISDKNTKEILGAHIISDVATEIIHSISLAKSSELIVEDFQNTIFPHPTISEMFLEAFLDINKKAIHK